MARSEQVPVSSLVLDFDVYPRHELDTANVASITRALEAGIRPEPIIADKASRRVVDGFHRVRAVQRHDGPEATIAVTWRSYAGDADLFVDAVALNATHGVRLTRYDQARCLLIAEQLHVDAEVMAGALHVTADVTAKLRAAKTAIDPDGQPMPIRRTSRHLAGRKLTARQRAAERRTGGMSIVFYADQVCNAVAGDLVDWSHEPSVEALRALDETLHAAVAKVGV